MTAEPRIEITATGWVDRADSAFPKAVQLADGDVLCSYSNAGGSWATGGTGLSRSRDGGRTWTREADILPGTTEPRSSNFLKPSVAPDGVTVYAYGSRSGDHAGLEFGEREAVSVLCTSRDGGRTWSAPAEVPMPSRLLEVSDAALVTRSGRLLAPAATIEPDHLGERVVLAISDDGGRSWPRSTTCLRDPDGRLGYLEQKLTELPDGRLLATAWTATMAGLVDRSNSFALSADGGLTWSPPRSIGTMGQTLSVTPLGGDRLLVLYNRRYGRQGVVIAIARLDEQGPWPILWEGLVHDAAASRERAAGADAIEEMKAFAFGFPTAVRLADGELLATWWQSLDGDPLGTTGVAYARLRVVG
ncbi:MAG: sialidase family protein [Chloroflexota bacterium]